LSMRHTILASALISFLGAYVSPACAWWDAGHMQIAYVAYKHLDAPVKDKVDALLKLNADYSKWTAGALDEKGQALCLRACRDLADDIKRKEYGYTRDNVNSATAAQNIGSAGSLWGSLRCRAYCSVAELLVPRMNARISS
jgi:hypothetical protein